MLVWQELGPPSPPAAAGLKSRSMSKLVKVWADEADKIAHNILFITLAIPSLCRPSLARLTIVVTVNGASVVGVGIGIGAGGVVVVVAVVVVVVVVVANAALPFPGFWVLRFGDRQGRDGAAASG